MLLVAPQNNRHAKVNFNLGLICIVIKVISIEIFSIMEKDVVEFWFDNLSILSIQINGRNVVGET